MVGARGLVLSTLLGSVVAATLDEVLLSFKGKSKVDCSAVCAATGGTFSGMGMSSKGSLSTYKCNCGSSKVVVVCNDSPFTLCCKDKCDVGLSSVSPCKSTPAGFTCPANGGCAGGKCKAPNWQEWVAAHNVYRCMHDVPPVSWSEAVFEDANDHFQTVKTMVHSKCYKVAPPAGPAGENLFIGTGTYSPLQVVRAWYSEIANCGPLPGCRSGNTGAVGHFTAMAWQGDREIGCFKNEFGLQGCRYKAFDFLSCHTPNFGSDEDYVKNVYPVKFTFKECVEKVKACGLPEPRDANRYSAKTGLVEVWSDAEGHVAQPKILRKTMALVTGPVAPLPLCGLAGLALLFLTAVLGPAVLRGSRAAGHVMRDGARGFEVLPDPSERIDTEATDLSAEWAGHFVE